jgi:NAD-dependent dihydropyrimidine dehydrogenase PreA subunit
MIRKIINIDEEKCNGCGACANACHEGAIKIVNGKARLIRDDYCDAFGDCLPSCPTGAITFTEREAAQYDRQAVLLGKVVNTGIPHTGCPGSNSRSISRSEVSVEKKNDTSSQESLSQLTQWPVQIKLAPVNAPYFNNAKLLIAADCTAFSRADFHEMFIKGHITLIGCPKLDSVDYSEKLTEIIKNNDIKNITVVRMEVPCCGGIENAVKKAIINSGKMLPWQVVTISIDGKILD